MAAVFIGGVVLAAVGCSRGDDSPAPTEGSFEQMLTMFPADVFMPPMVVTYVDLEALDRVAGTTRPDRADRAAVDAWVRDVLSDQNASRITMRGVPVDLDAGWRQEVGFDLLDVRQSLSGSSAIVESLSILRLAVPLETVTEAVLAEPVWGDEYETVIWNDVEFLDSGVERGTGPSIVDRTDTRPIGLADQIWVRDDVLVSTGAADVMHAAIDSAGGPLSESPAMDVPFDVTRDVDVVQAVMFELPLDGDQARFLVGMQVLSGDGNLSTIGVITAGSPEAADAITESAKTAELVGDIGEASFETQGSSTVIRAESPDAWRILVEAMQSGVIELVSSD